jgi:hypothetical protein
LHVFPIELKNEDENQRSRIGYMALHREIIELFQKTKKENPERREFETDARITIRDFYERYRVE